MTMETTKKVDYPAAHSMDTDWFAIDDAGEVAYMESFETGPVPNDAARQTSYWDLFHHLPKDECGVPVFPIEHDPFPSGRTTGDLEAIFAGLPDQEREAIRQLALGTSQSAAERSRLKASVSRRFLQCVVWLVDPADVKELEEPLQLVRLDSTNAIYHACGAYVDILCLLLKGRLLAWRPTDDLDRGGLTSVYGIHVFEADRPADRRYLNDCLFPPDAPPEYKRIKTPNQPRIGLPAKVMAAEEVRTVGAGENRLSFPFVHSLPGVRFSQMEWIQIADFVPCFDWNLGSLVPAFTDSVVRRNMAIAHDADSPERDRRITEWRQAAEQGDPLARYSLGYLYGQGALPDYEQACHWYRRTAEQAEASPSDSKNVFENGSAAQCCLADMYERGVGVPQDYRQALDWYGKSAAKENPVAQYRLGMMYKDGRGVAKDRVQARAWLTRSADHGYQPARVMRWETPDFEGAEEGDTESQYQLASMLEQGIGMAKDAERARYWYKLAAAQGHAKAQYRSGLMFLIGDQVSADLAQAREWFAKAAAQGHEHAKRELADIELWAAGERRSWITGDQGHVRAIFEAACRHAERTNYVLAAYWYRRVAEHADTKLLMSPEIFKIGSDAQASLGTLYENGRGVRQDFEQALHWYRNSAAKANRTAQYHLGLMYLNGQGVPKDIGQARAWLGKSAEQGDEQARSALLKITKRAMGRSGASGGIGEE